MRPILKGAMIGALAVVVAGVTGAVMFVKTTGLDAGATPGSVETTVARRLRAFAVPREYANLRNPVLSNDESVRNGMAHFADHCAICHANNGSGDTEMGRGMFPRAPDMREAATQELTDGSLFYLIEHGVRFTGMPAWATGTVDGEESSWHLVNFIRQLPHLTEEQVLEMEAMNPRSPAEIRQEIEEQRFLQGDDPPAADSPATQGH